MATSDVAYYAFPQVEAVAEGQHLPAELRDRLEQCLVEAGQRIAVDVTRGNVRVTIALENGRVRWVEPTLVRVPASRLDDDLAVGAGSGSASVLDVSE